MRYVWHAFPKVRSNGTSGRLIWWHWYVPTPERGTDHTDHNQTQGGSPPSPSSRRVRGRSGVGILFDQPLIIGQPALQVDIAPLQVENELAQPLDCEFQTIPATHSTGNRPVIPAVAGQRSRAIRPGGRSSGGA